MPQSIRLEHRRLINILASNEQSQRFVEPVSPVAKRGIANIKPHMLGYQAQQLPVASILLNSNESAFGPSPYAVEAAKAAVSTIERYCENPTDILAPVLASRFELNQDYIALGPGSDDLLARLCRAYLEPDTELIRSANGYLKVPNYAYANNASPVSAADENFTAYIDNILAKVTDNTRIVYLANPDNPSGTWLPPSEVQRLHSGLPSDVLLVLDCAYEEYVDSADYTPTQHLVESANNIAMTRTFSKIFGLAGARVGWLYAHPDIVDTVNRIALTFPIASSSLTAAVAALEDKTHTDYVYTVTAKLRRKLSDSLTEIGLRVYPSQANFVLIDFADHKHSAEQAYNYLRQHGVSTRRFASPAFNDCVRITLGLEHDVNFAKSLIKKFLTT